MKRSRAARDVGGYAVAQQQRGGLRFEQELREAERLMSAGGGLLARALLNELLKAAPHSPDVRRLLAIEALMDSRPGEALEHALLGSTAAPHRADLAMLVGRSHKSLGQVPQAIEAYRTAIRLDSRLAEAHVSLGIALKAIGDLDAAISSYRAALAVAPDLAAAHLALGNALSLQWSRSGIARADVDAESLSAMRRAVELDPANAKARHQLGVSLAQIGRPEEALENFNVALAVEPDREDICILMHSLLTKLDRLPAARECCERWLELNPPTPSVVSRLVTTLLALNELDAALRWVETVRTLAPDMPEALHNLSMVCQQYLDMPAAVSHLRRAIEIAPAYYSARQALLMTLNYFEESPEVILEEHLMHAPLSPPAARATRFRANADQRLRIGYVSGDLRRHSVAYFLEPTLAEHDRSRFAVTAYSTSRVADEVTERLKACTTAWVDAADSTNDELVRRIREDGIDVLIDLSGHTDGGRLEVFAARPAALQLTYLGYPTTTGLRAMDYRISDNTIDPPGADAWSSEKILRCPRGMFCYQPDAEPEVGELPALQNGYITFGSFNNLAKVSPKTIALWAAVLHAVPHSRLLLKARSLSSTAVRSRLVQRLNDQGIGEERLLLNPWSADLQSHLDVYREVDIGLDTYPYNGATTTCESLWMGVPVVSLCGPTHVSRMGASILRSAGMSGWSATSAEEFVQLAAARAADLGALAGFRASARAQLRGSALMDAAGHTAALEALILAAWDQHVTAPQ